MTSKVKTSSGALPNVRDRLGPIEYRSPALLTAYENNPRKHPEKQLIKLMRSITEFGFALPVLVDADSVIVAGHARVEAARRLGLAELPVIVADQWSKAQVRAYRLADNRLGELSSWDNDALAIELSFIMEIDDVSMDSLGWETAEIDLIVDGAVLADNEPDLADEVPEPGKVTVSAPGDLWELGKHRLLCGSSLEAAAWERLMAGSRAAMVFTDPPYNVPVSGHVCGLGSVRHAEFAMASGEINKAKFTAFLTEVIRQMTPHLKDGAVLDLCMDWRHCGELLSAIESNQLALLNLCVWAKNNGGMSSLYRSRHELVFIAKKGRAPHTNNVELGKHGRYRTNVWECAGVNSFGKNRMDDLADHPTVKPTALVADAIRDVTAQGEIVLDAFMGSGTTIAGAERTKRVAYGIEIEPTYVDVAVRRWENLTGKRAVLSATGETFAEVAARRMSEHAQAEHPMAAEAA